MTNNAITASALTAAADLIIRIRDAAIAAERDIRADNPIADFMDGIELIFETDDTLSPDTIDAICALLDTLD